jgi:integrase
LEEEYSAIAAQAKTACRRSGALGLRLMDLDVEHGLVRLAEKGGTLRWQPISLHLATCLVEHAAARGAVLPTDGLLRFCDGRAVTSRRYDHLWYRLGQRLPWVAAQGISTHGLRHTTLTWVERHFGYVSPAPTPDTPTARELPPPTSRARCRRWLRPWLRWAAGDHPLILGVQ